MLSEIVDEPIDKLVITVGTIETLALTDRLAFDALRNKGFQHYSLRSRRNTLYQPYTFVVAPA